MGRISDSKIETLELVNNIRVSCNPTWVIEPTTQRGRYLFWCEGCGCCHSFWTEGEPKWQWNNNGIKPTISPSILVRFKEEICHLLIHDGKIQYLNDCTHNLKGQTLDLIPLNNVK